MQAGSTGLRLGVCLLYAAVAWGQSVTIEPGRTIDRVIAPGETHNYSLGLRANQLVRLFFQQVLPFETTARLCGPDGGVVAERVSRQNILFSAIAPNAGRYTMEVIAPKATGRPAAYVIRHVEIRDALGDDPAVLQADADYTDLRRRAGAPSPESAAKLDAAAALYAKRSEFDFEGWTLLVGGQYWVRLSDYKQAAAHYEQSAAAFVKTNNTAGRVRALDFLGDIRAVLRDYSRAIEAANEELRISREEKFRDTEAAALVILGRAYSGLGQKQRAIESFQQALPLARQIGDPMREAASLSSLANLHNALGNHEKALQYYQDVLGIQRARGASAQLDQAAALNNVGSTYAQLGERAKAADFFEQAATLFRSTGGGRPALATTLSDLGQLYVATGQLEKGEPALQEALAIARDTKNRFGEAYALMNLGRLRRARDDAGGAAEKFAAALAVPDLRDPNLEATTHHELAKLERDRGNLEAAREHSAAAIQLAESLRGQVAVPDLRSSILASASDFFDLHVDVLMRMYRASGETARMIEARAVADRRRARNLVDVLSQAGIAPSSASADLSAQERKLREELNRLSAQRVRLIQSNPPVRNVSAIDRQIDEKWTEYQSARVKLLAADPLATAQGDAAFDLDVIRHEALDGDTVLLEYSLGVPRSYLWVISSDQLLAFDLPTRAEIEQTARGFAESAKRTAYVTASERAARRVSELILAPAASAIAGKRVIVVADGALQYVPFAALADPAQTAAYRPLIAAHEVIEEPSASTLPLLRRARSGRIAAPRTLAVFADPVFEADDPRVRRDAPASALPDTPAFLTRAAELRLARLPATREEGRTIAALLPESQRLLAMGFDVNRQAVSTARLGGYRMLHFATHGVLETSQPELSALALSLFDEKGRPQDGFLRLFEIYNLKLQADLVVLSACDTALGKNLRGEGLVGLARGFMYAGAPRVVASLWKVDDRATSELMRHFYTAMLGPRKVAPAAALREAQLAIAKQPQWRSPYYWAAFVLQGEWK